MFQLKRFVVVSSVAVPAPVAGVVTAGTSWLPSSRMVKFRISAHADVLTHINAEAATIHVEFWAESLRWLLFLRIFQSPRVSMNGEPATMPCWCDRPRLVARQL